MGRTKVHPEGSYFIEWWDQGKRRCIPAGADAQDAADKARVKEAQLTAERNGIIPPLPQPEPAPQRISLTSALDGYLELRARSSILANFPHLPAHSQFLQNLLCEAPC